MIREITQIKEHWLKEEQILGLYSMEDVPIEDSSEQALVYHDLGNRFLCFFPNGREENESDPDKSVLFFKRSLEKKFSWEAANNLAIALFSQGKPKEATAYLSQVGTKDSDDIVKKTSRR